MAAGMTHRSYLRCNKCRRVMRGTTAYDGACECGGLVETILERKDAMFYQPVFTLMDENFKELGDFRTWLEATMAATRISGDVLCWNDGPYKKTWEATDGRYKIVRDR